jgi:hypothetical protein
MYAFEIRSGIGSPDSLVNHVGSTECTWLPSQIVEPQVDVLLTGSIGASGHIGCLNSLLLFESNVGLGDGMIGVRNMPG